MFFRIFAEKMLKNTADSLVHLLIDSLDKMLDREDLCYQGISSIDAVSKNSYTGRREKRQPAELRSSTIMASEG